MSKGAKAQGRSVRFEVRYDEYGRKVKLEEGGLIKISGNFLLDHEEEVLNLIKHEGKLAAARNPRLGITRIEKSNGKIEVGISDHNLALHIGKCLRRAYKGNHKYKFLKGEKFVEVEWRRD